jgi:hypothetical protein
MPHNSNYGETAIAEFISRLGCCRYADPEAHIPNRDPGEYRRLLLLLIEVNKTRRDKVGFMETQAALKALKNLDKLK